MAQINRLSAKDILSQYGSGALSNRTLAEGPVAMGSATEVSPLVKLDPNRASAVMAAVATKKMGWFSLLAVSYFLVCGGAYGTEDIGGSIPPLYALLGLVTIPWIWSLPTALATAEMASTFPNDGGFLYWIKLGLGDFFGFMDSWIMLWIIVIDQSLYPLIFVGYFENILELSYLESWGVCLMYVAFAALLNLVGGYVVGKASEIFAAITLLPFLIFFLTGFASPHFDASNWFATTGSWDLSVYMSVLIWATCGFEYAGFLIGDVENGKRTFPLVMVAVVALAVLTYLGPTMVAIAVWPLERRNEIREGMYPVIAEHIGLGSWMGLLMIFGGLGSTMGTYSAYLRTSATALHALALDGKAPRFFSYFFDRFKVPIVPIIFYSVCTAGLTLFDFTILVEIEAFMYCLHQIMLMAAFIATRYYFPAEERPFAVPFGWPGAIFTTASVVAVALLTIGTMYTQMYQNITALIVMLIGGIAYLAYHYHLFVKQHKSVV